ncbi:Ku protein [Actinospongicola halichondriae]|uniref:non-homologous end joining protein Ku n=1 Tax=Actinospongicola halichondriae TaxID=3236844 RepID=UPI003D43BE57
MPRAIWSGSISFGLVNIPVKLYSAVSRKSVRFNQIDRNTGSRIKYKKVSAESGDEVDNDDIIKGYELSSGEYVTVSDDELAQLDPRASRTIEIEEFVDLVDIDPLFYDSAYYLAPDKATVKPYALLSRAMEQSGKVGIARVVMRTKQYLCAVRPQDGALVMSTMVYADEINAPEQIAELAEVSEVEVSDKELTMANQLIESLSEDFDPTKYEDTYRERVLEVIERKAAGEEDIIATPEPQEDKVVDLMAALEASVAAAKEARTRHPSGAEPGSDEKPKAKKSTAKAKKSA